MDLTSSLHWAGIKLLFAIESNPPFIFTCRDLSWPRLTGLWTGPWEGLSERFNGIDVVPQIQELAKAFSDSLFDEPLWPELTEGKGREIQRSCLDRQAASRPASEGSADDDKLTRSPAAPAHAADKYDNQILWAKTMMAIHLNFYSREMT